MRAIAHILETPLENHGGLNVLARVLAESLAETYKVYVFSPQSNYSNISFNDPNENFTHITWTHGMQHTHILVYLKEKIQELNIELIIFHGGDFSWGPGKRRFSIINYVSRLGTICIFVNHQTTPRFSTLPALETQSIIFRFKIQVNFCISWFLKGIQLINTKAEITVSKSEADEAKKRYPFFKDKITCIYHSRLEPLNNSFQLRSKKEKTILSIGHFAYRKGQHVLLQAFGPIASKHKSWRLRLVGLSAKDAYWNYLCQIVEKYGISEQTEFVEETRSPDVYFRTASIYVQPSLAEAYGLALQEAMYFGCACIGSDTGGIRNSITSNDMLFPAGDHSALSGILDRLMGEDEIVAKHRHTSIRNTIEFNRNRESMVESYRKIIDSTDNKRICK